MVDVPNGSTLLEIIVAVALAVTSAIAGFFVTAFGAGRKLGEIVTTLHAMNDRIERLDGRLETLSDRFIAHIEHGKR